MYVFFFSFCYDLFSLVELYSGQRHLTTGPYTQSINKSY